MTEDRMQANRVIDTAVGILVGWRRYSTQSAFRELLSASERQHVPLFAMAEALVKLAGQPADALTTAVAAEQGAQREWGRGFLTTDPAASECRPVNRWL